MLEWGINMDSAVHITLPLSYTNYYRLLTTVQSSHTGGREAEGTNFTLNGWDCALAYAASGRVTYWDASVSWFTIGH